MDQPRSPTSEHNDHSYISPPYTRHRYNHHDDDRTGGHRRENHHQAPNLQWRPKSPVINQEVTPPSAPFFPPNPVGRNLDTVDFPPLPTVPSREEIMEELRVVTLQYMNCSDPVEREARKQRVLQSELNGVVEETATHILHASTSAAMARLASSPVPIVEEPIPEEGVSVQAPETQTRKRGRPPKPKDNRNSIRLSPKSFSGMGSKKRNLARIQASPGTSSRHSRTSRASTRQNRTASADTASPIVLIPAIFLC
ncbi:hypothetical protein YC2023_019723 [Brassica napus]